MNYTDIYFWRLKSQEVLEVEDTDGSLNVTIVDLITKLKDFDESMYGITIGI